MDEVVTVWPTAAATAKRIATRAEASLTRDSPLRMVTMRRGMRSFSVTAVAATASGGETMAPSARATGQVKPGITATAMAAMPTVVNITQPVARKAMGRRLLRKSFQEVVQAAAYKSGGRMRVKRTSGLRGMEKPAVW